MFILLSCIIFIPLVLYFNFCIRMQKCNLELPPGPTGLPFLGNLHQLGGNAANQLARWAQQYGKLYTIHLGTKPALVINDAALMKEIFGLTASTGKFHSEVFNVLFGGPYGILNTGGKVWVEQRPFFVKTLNNTVFSNISKCEPLILKKMDKLCEWIKQEMSDKGKIYLNEVLKRTMGSIIWATITEEGTESQIGCLLEDFMQALQKISNSGLPFFSWIKHVAPNMSGYNNYSLACRKLQEFIRINYEDPRRSEGHHTDFLYKYKEHNESMKRKGSSFYGEEGRRHCLASILGLLMGGSETTASTLTFLIFYLCVYPDVQKKVQEEIAEISEKDADVTLEDRLRMPYTEAVIEETLRLSVATPIGILHVLLEDVSVCQYKLPKDLILVANLHHALTDPKVWEDPTMFKPERFLENMRIKKGQEASPRELKDAMVAFQPGKRTCPGQQMARDVLFLLTTKLLKTFTFSSEPGRNKEEYLEKLYSMIQMPKKLPVVAKINNLRE